MSKSTKFSDRGKARYFYGRKNILNMFREILKKAREAKGGTIFLVQAPPGAEKIAKAVGTRETVTDSSPQTTLDMLRAEEKPLLLVLDEAQKLWGLWNACLQAYEKHWKIYLKIFITTIWTDRSYFWLQVWG